MTVKRHTNNRVNGRPKNRNGTVTIQITVTTQIADALDKVAATGLFGANRAAAAERLMSENLRGLLRDGFVQKTAKAME
jgi:hypothetical protein